MAAQPTVQLVEPARGDIPESVEWEGPVADFLAANSDAPDEAEVAVAELASGSADAVPCGFFILRRVGAGADAQ